MATTKAKKTETNKDGFAVIFTGGKQYVVRVGDVVKIEKMSDDHKVGDKVTFDKVLLTDASIGAPHVSGASVAGTVKEIDRDAKIMVIHYKQKSKYFKKYGHRQEYVKVAIDSL